MAQRKQSWHGISVCWHEIIKAAKIIMAKSGAAAYGVISK